MITKLVPILRKFPIDISGEGNIPIEGAIFVGNHSNSHDTFVAKEVFSKIKRPVAQLVAWDGLSLVSRLSFYLGNCTFIKRTERKSIEKGIIKLCSKVLNGNNGFIFGEATWNLHPVLPMQKIKAGVVQASLITGKPIVPVIIEYIEVPKLCTLEKEMYSRCVVRFGEPIFPSVEGNIFKYAENVQVVMESMRREIWTEYGINKEIEPFMIDDAILKKKNIIMSSSTVRIEDKFIATIQCNPRKNFDDEQIRRIIREIIKGGVEIDLSKIYVRILSANEKYPLTGSGKRSIRALEEMKYDNATQLLY